MKHWAFEAAPPGTARSVGPRQAAARRTRSFVALAFLLLASPLAAGGPASQAEVPTPFLPIEAVHAGMQGTARTVFEGNKLEEFGVEILGVLKNAIGPQQDLILARLHGPKVEFTGVVAGMSGSPVYVDGKLVGALSYRIGQFAKEAIAGITPIADMIKLERGSAGADGRSVEVAPDLLGRFLASTAREGSALDVKPEPRTGGDPWQTTASQSGLRPIGTPLVCSGCDAAVLRYYGSVFEASGLEPSAGGGGTAEPATPLPLDPGTAIGGALVTGDLSLTGIGTLTYVQGTKVFAFGHPLLGTGPMEMPMTQAEILLTFPSSAASFKIANATRPVGTIVQDGLTAIMGEVGRVPPTIPVTVSVRAPQVERAFRYDILRQRAWSPLMVAVTTANSLSRTVEFDASATLDATLRVDIEGIPPVEVEDLYSGINPTQPVHLEVANDAGSLFGLLFNNRFEEPKVKRVDVSVEALPPSRIATVTSLSVSAAAVRPGEPFRVTATLTPYRGAERQVVFEAHLPEDTAPGETEIIVASGPALEGLDRRVLERQVIQASGLGDLIRIVGRSKKSHDLYLRVSRRSPSAIVRSDILPDLPLSVFTVFNNPRLSADATLMIEAPILEISRNVDLVAVGGRRISLKVK